ncbi:MAG TPA: hypothetical protein VIP77_04850 [Jiangellaceae bacterium]
MNDLRFVVQLHDCPPEFRTLEDLTETLRCISLPNWQGGPDDFRVWRWTDGQTPEEITLRKARGSELRTTAQVVGGGWWWVAEGASGELYAAVPALDGTLEERLQQAFRRAADDFTDFRADDLAEIAMRALTPGDGQTPPADLIKGTEGHGSFDYCIVCGAKVITHRALFVQTVLRSAVRRVAWCSADRCQEDRAGSAVRSVPVAVGPGGIYTVTDTWE